MYPFRGFHEPVNNQKHKPHPGCYAAVMEQRERLACEPLWQDWWLERQHSLCFPVGQPLSLSGPKGQRARTIEPHRPVL